MGQLILLGNSIGNLGDLTSRVKEALIGQTHFICEDTQKFKNLLNLLDIAIKDKSITSFHSQTDVQKAKSLAEEVFSSDKNYHYISESGSPGISDPAYILAREYYALGGVIDHFPGPSAVTSALELSNLPANPYTFWGFLPRQAKKIEEVFQKGRDSGGTQIFFESPKRIRKSLEILKSALPEASVVLCREMTKKFQTVYRFEQAATIDLVQIPEKGEFVLLTYSKKGGRPEFGAELVELGEDYLDNQGKRNTKALAKILAKLTGRSSKAVYTQLCSD